MNVRTESSPRGPRIVLELGDEERVLSIERAAEMRDGITAALRALQPTGGLAIDRAEIERLIAEAKEADSRMTPGPWMAEGGVLYHDSEDDGTIALASLTGDACVDDDIAVARTRNNLPAVAAALTQLLAKVDAMRPVVEAAERVVDRKSIQSPIEQLMPIVAAYRVSREGR